MRASQRFVVDMSSALNAAGLPPLPSRVFSALLVDDDGRMTAAELAGSLSVSPAGVSGAVGYLERVRMLRRERSPGERFDTFVVDEDAWHAAMLSVEALYTPMIAALDGVLAADAPDSGTGDDARVRLALTREFLLFVQQEMAGMAKRWDRHRRKVLRDL